MKSSTRYLAVLIALLLIAAVAAGQAAEPTHRVTDAVGATLDVVLPITVDTIPTTTTTTELTTTTTIPTTTTTFGTPSGDNFNVKLRVEGGQTMWETPYFLALPSGAEWLAEGDRCGYRALYAFLADPAFVTAENPDGIVGRVEFTRAAGYAVVLDDRFPDKTTRHFDGTPVAPGSPGELGECPAPDVEYLPYVGPDQRPTIRYVAGDRTLEVRDYKATASPGEPWLVDTGQVRFQQFSATADRVTVVAYFLDPVSGEYLPAMVVYYTSLVPGVEMTTDLG